MTNLKEQFRKETYGEKELILLNDSRLEDNWEGVKDFCWILNNVIDLEEWLLDVKKNSPKLKNFESFNMALTILTGFCESKDKDEEKKIHYQILKDRLSEVLTNYYSEKLRVFIEFSQKYIEVYGGKYREKEVLEKEKDLEIDSDEEKNESDSEEKEKKIKPLKKLLDLISRARNDFCEGRDIEEAKKVWESRAREISNLESYVELLIKGEILPEGKKLLVVRFIGLDKKYRAGFGAGGQEGRWEIKARSDKKKKLNLLLLVISVKIIRVLLSKLIKENWK